MKDPEPPHARAAWMWKYAMIVALLMSASQNAHAAPSPDPLWLKAVDLTGKNKQWLPGITELRMEFRDDKGALKESYQSRYRISAGDNGEPQTHVEKAVRNGVDETAKESQAQEKKNREGGKAASVTLTFQDSPFDPAVQADVEVTPLNRTQTVGDLLCVLFAFRQKQKDGSTIEGTAALQRESGAPVEVTYSTKPLPRGVQEMTVKLSYGNDGLLREMTVAGAGGFLFIKRSFHTVVSLEGYWKYAKELSRRDDIHAAPPNRGAGEEGPTGFAAAASGKGA